MECVDESNVITVTREDCLAVIRKAYQDYQEACIWWRWERIFGNWCHQSCLVEEVRQIFGHDAALAIDNVRTAKWLMGEK